MTLEDLHEKTGFSKSYLSTVEGAKHNISLDNMDRIAQALGVSLYAMLVPHDDKTKGNS
jgi:transcriptional regulator with XRE-family HTH domain